MLHYRLFLLKDESRFIQETACASVSRRLRGSADERAGRGDARRRTRPGSAPAMVCASPMSDLALADGSCVRYCNDRCDRCKIFLIVARACERCRRLRMLSGLMLSMSREPWACF